jgi:hypothetical protein
MENVPAAGAGALILRNCRQKLEFGRRGPSKIMICFIETLHFTYSRTPYMVGSLAGPSQDGGKHPKTEAIVDARKKDNG